jgi:hypothetical protein
MVVNGGPIVLLDLCGNHREEYFAPLLMLISAHGMTEDGKPVGSITRSSHADGVTCSICQRSLASLTVLSHHMKNQHPDDYPAYMESRGKTAQKCGVKGCGQVFYGPQAMAMHKFRSHPD